MKVTTFLAMASTILLLACRAEEPSADPAAEPGEGLSPRAPAPEGPGEPVDEQTLRRFFDSEQIAAAAEYHQAVASTSDAASVAALYARAVTLEGELLGPTLADDSEIWPHLEDYLEADLGLRGLTSACVAECTMPALHLDFDFFRAQARATPEDVDDAFFEILGTAYDDRVSLADGRIVSWPAFFEQTWDYGGHSKLGSGIHLKLLVELDSFPSESLFVEPLSELRRRLLEDANSRCLGLPAAEASRELGEILEAVELSPEERESLIAHREKLAAPAEHGIEEECGKMGGCACNSG